MLLTLANFLRTVVYVLLWTFFFKYLIDKFRRDSQFVKFASQLPGPIDFPLIGSGIEFLIYGIVNIWRRTRKRLQPIFAKNVVLFQTPLINETVKKYVNLMGKEINGPEFDLNDYMPYLAASSFLKVHFDVQLTPEENRYYNFHRILNLIGEKGVASIMIPWMRINFILELAFGKKVIAATARLRKFINEVKDTKLPKAEENWDVKAVKIETLSKSLLSTIRQLQDEMKLDDYLFQEIGVMTCAAAETTAIISSFFLLSVAMYPDIQSKLHDELRDVFGDDDRVTTIDDFAKLLYFDQVIKETHRRFTLVPVIFRGVEEDVKIGSMTIPAKTTIMVRIADIHMNPNLYPNPHEFNPENFSPEAVKNRSKYSFIPFSAGTRDCIGKSYAETVTKLALIELMRKYEFHTTTKMEDIQYALSFTVGKRGGYYVSISPR